MRLFVALIGLLSVPLVAQVSGNVTSRVFEIRTVPPKGTASAFVVGYAAQQYIITANHVVEGLGDHGRIELLINSVWEAFDVRIAHGKRTCIDVAALLQTRQKITNAEALPWIDTFFVAQEAYFLGFPYGLSMHAANMHLTIPLIKHGYISGVLPCSLFYPDAAATDETIILDGINNLGFSGGPVVIHDPNAPDKALKVTGIVSGFKGEKQPVMVGGRASEGSVQTNTGLIEVVPFNYAIELMKELQKPKAPETKKK